MPNNVVDIYLKPKVTGPISGKKRLPAKYLITLQVQESVENNPTSKMDMN